MNSSWLAEKGLQFTKKLYFCAANGELPEWSIGADSKSVEPYGVPGVRIPHSPPVMLIFSTLVSSYTTFIQPSGK